MGLLRLQLVLALAACRPEDTGEPTDTTTPPTDTTTPTTGTTPTVTVTEGPPTALAVTCTPRENVLRYDCTVTVDPPQPVQVRYRREDGLGAERVHTSAAIAGTHVIPVYFLASGHVYDLFAEATLWPESPPAATQFSPAPVPPIVDSHLEVQGAATVQMIGTNNPCAPGAIAQIYDTSTGETLWFQNLDFDGNLGVLDMIRFTDDGRIMGETHGHVSVMNPNGDQLVKLPVDLGAHHDMMERDGLFYLLYREDVYDMQLDKVVILDAKGTLLGEWHPFDHLPIPANGTGDYLHTNAIWVDEAGDIYLSWFQQYAVGKIAGLNRPDFGEIDWILSGSTLDELGNDFETDWSQIPAPAGFVIQHGLHLTHDGRVMFLDNGNGRGIVFSVDPAKGTATADEVYPTVESACGAQGTTQDTLAGDVFAGCAGPNLREYTRDGELLWDSQIVCGNGNAGLPARWYPLDGAGWQTGPATAP